MTVWKYVALGDSFPAGFGVGGISYVNYLAESLKEDYTIKVDVENFAQSGARTDELLSLIRANQTLRTTLMDADLVTIWIGWNDMIYSLSLFDSEVCGGDDGLDCIKEAADQIRVNLDKIYIEILKLVQKKGARIFIADNAIPQTLIEMWNYFDRFEQVKEAAFDSWRRHLIQAAEERGIGVARSFQVINGSAGDTIIEGITQADGFHLNKKGHMILSEVHKEAIGGFTK